MQMRHFSWFLNNFAADRDMKPVKKILESKHFSSRWKSVSFLFQFFFAKGPISTWNEKLRGELWKEGQKNLICLKSEEFQALLQFMCRKPWNRHSVSLSLKQQNHDPWKNATIRDERTQARNKALLNWTQG